METKVRVMVLYMYGLGATKIMNLMEELGYEGTPAVGTIEAWAREGILTDGVKWKLMRKAVAPMFDHMARHKYERDAARDYATWADDTRGDLDKMQNLIVGQMASMEFRPADFARIVSARQTIENSMTERMEMTKSYLLAIGRILNGIAGIVQNKFKSVEVNQAMAFFLDRTVSEFEEFLRVGTHDPKRILEGNYGLSGSAGFIAPGGSDGEDEAEV